MEAVVLDTDVFSYFFKQDTRAQVYETDIRGRQVCLCFQTVAEVKAWAIGRQWGPSRRDALDRTLAHYVVLPFDADGGRVGVGHRRPQAHWPAHSVRRCLDRRGRLAVRPAAVDAQRAALSPHPGPEGCHSPRRTSMTARNARVPRRPRARGARLPGPRPPHVRDGHLRRLPAAGAGRGTKGEEGFNTSSPSRAAHKRRQVTSTASWFSSRFLRSLRLMVPRRLGGLPAQTPGRDDHACETPECMQERMQLPSQGIRRTLSAASCER